MRETRRFPTCRDRLTLSKARHHTAASDRATRMRSYIYIYIYSSSSSSSSMEKRGTDPVTRSLCALYIVTCRLSNVSTFERAVTTCNTHTVTSCNTHTLLATHMQSLPATHMQHSYVTLFVAVCLSLSLWLSVCLSHSLAHSLPLCRSCLIP